MEDAGRAVFEVDLAVDERGIGARGRFMERPREVGIAERDAVQGEQGGGPGAAQAVGGLTQEVGEFFGESGPAERNPRSRAAEYGPGWREAPG
jgi:hypothetical protein